MLSQRNSTLKDGVLEINDVTEQTLLRLGEYGAIVLGIGGIFFLNICVIAVAIIAWFHCHYRGRALTGGVRLDLNNSRLAFPGGGISANTMQEMFTKEHWIQAYKRYDIALDEIQMVECKNNPIVNNRDRSLKWVYVINLTGTFGSAIIPFSEEEKRNQLYATIIQVNNMGIPVINR